MNQLLPRWVIALAYTCVFAFLGCSGAGDARVSRSDGGGTAESEGNHFDPTAQRAPRPSKSLKQLSADWQPPAPTRTGPARVKPRVTPSKHWGAPPKTLGPRPSDSELRLSSNLREPLRPVPGTSTVAETEALSAALREEWRDDRTLDALERFLEAYPASRWAPGIHLNLGSLSYERGYFQSALAHWKAGWELAKEGKDEVSTDFANLALAESAKMNARIGRRAELEALLAEAQKRTLMGDARVKIGDASEGAWMMRHQPGVSFRCGPFAVMNVARVQAPRSVKTTKVAAFLEKNPSPPTGFSIPEVLRMSVELGIDLQIAKREVGAPVIVPAVVHWKLGHFGALVREERASTC